MDNRDTRGRLLAGVTGAGVALWVSTESLSVVSLIGRGTLVLWWVLVVAGLSVWLLQHRQRLTWPTGKPDAVVLLGLGVCALVLLLTAIAAWSSPPNSSDAMAYHLPRVVYWAEQGSIRFFPTAYLNQIMLQPLAEYAMLHLYVITGGDQYINFVQWGASLISLIAVSRVAAQLGAGARGQVMAAVFCATLPAGILASSGAKNDYMLAMWLTIAVSFALRGVATGRTGDALQLGGALGCALLTKATAYVFAPWVLLAVFVLAPKGVGWRSRGRVAGVAVLAALVMNAPQYLRNLGLSGSPLGFDSAQGNGLFRWRNETFGGRPTVSNGLRNLSEQLGARSPSWNRNVYEAVLAAHRWIGSDPNDPLTTWRGSTYGPPKNANHEADAPNRWHLLLLLLAAGVLTARGWRTHDWTPTGYAAGLAMGFVLFGAYLKWQPFMARLFLPWFVLGAPLAGLALDGWRHRWAWLPHAALMLFLLDGARLPLLENWVRPLRGPRSVLHTARDKQYFADMTLWHNEAAFAKTVALLEKQPACRLIGIDTTNFQLEYPLMALLREKWPGILFIHTGVTNASSRYRPPVPGEPCAVVCLDCAGDTQRLSLYGSFAHQKMAEKFVILQRY